MDDPDCVDNCAGVDCSNNGDCEEDDEGYVCICDAEWTGVHCEIPIRCSAYDYEDGVVDGGIPAISCEDGVTTLAPGTGCSIDCGEGYMNDGAGTVNCPADATNGQAPEVDIICVPVCSVYEYEEGVVDSGSSETCADGVTELVGGLDCEIDCDDGYTKGGAGTVTCPMDPEPGQAPIVDITCTPESCTDT
eukprot:UN23007